MIHSMASIKKAKKMNKNLNLLGGQELDHLENLAKTLLDVQNTANSVKPRPLCRYKKSKDSPT